MKVLTEDRMVEFAREIAKSLCDDDSWLDNDLFNNFAEDNVHDLFKRYSENIYHEWTDSNIAEQAIKMVENLFPNHISDTPLTTSLT